MQKLTILNAKEIKRTREIMLKDYGCFLKEDYAYLQSDKDRIYLVNKDMAKIDLTKLRVDKVGLYFGEIKDQKIRLSKEGAQLLYIEAKKNGKDIKNIVELNKEELKKYFNGEDIGKDLGKENRFVLLEYEKDIFGCAKYKEGKIINFHPKIHRGEVIL